MRRTKIVATLGPASRDRSVLAAMLEAGVDVVRLNAAHGSAQEHTEAAALARSVAQELGRSVGVLVDLPGPKLRTGSIAGDEVELVAGQELALSARDHEGHGSAVSTTVKGLADLVSVGDEVYLADGEILAVVDRVRDGDVHTVVQRGGTLRSHKGLHLPRSEHHLDPFTPADASALRTALDLKADLIGLSFVRRSSDVNTVEARLPKRGHRPLLVAKIETSAALDNLDDIINAGDAVMVARGDLGIQVSADRVPLLQKEIIRSCNRAGRPVITATQMLESMTRSPLPTRAEINDVANAVIDGTDALMLSEETAIGTQPVEAVATMARTALTAETWPRDRAEPDITARRKDPVAWAVAHAAIAAAEDLDVAAVVCPSRSGATARQVAAFRPKMPVVGVSNLPRVLGALCLSWGVLPVHSDDSPGVDDEHQQVLAAARAAGALRAGDLVAVVGALPGPRAGSTDYARIVRVRPG